MAIAIETHPGCPFSDPSKLFDDLSTLRQKDHLEYSELIGGYVVTRYNDILHVLDHPELFSSRVTVPDPPAFILEKFHGKVPTRGTLLGWDNPDHDRLRRSVSSFFVPRRLARFEPMIRQLANELINDFVSDGSVDLKNHFALPLPLKVVSAIAGLDPERWRWTGRSLALFGGHSAFNGGTFEEKLQGIIDLHGYVADLIAQRKTDRRDDLISHIWNERDAGHVEMTDFEHLAMIPGLLLAGHETTTNLLSMGMAHILENSLWDDVSKNDTTRAAAIEELLRFESAITGMKREVIQAATVGVTSLKAGDILFVAYNSGSRDASRFPQPDKLVLNRQSTAQHLGFGRGMHACLGAPLARLLLRIELNVIRERLPNLRLTPRSSRQYDRIHEGRGIEELVVAWDLPSDENRHVQPKQEAMKVPARRTAAGRTVVVTVEERSIIADDILHITLAPKSGTVLPAWTPGSHIDFPVGSLGTRQYSLCSDPADSQRWCISILREEAGRGGSLAIHNDVRAGQELLVSVPRNHFLLKPAKRYLFVAGGIGITPIRPMIRAAQAASADYKVLYLGSSRSRMAFADELICDKNVTVWPKNELGRFDLSSITAEFENKNNDAAEGFLVYACGPSRMLSSLQDICRHVPSGTINIEHFDNANLKSPLPNRAFDVLLKRSGRTIHVPKDRSVLDVLNENGAGIMSTCARGTCGTCEVDVVDGELDHRDTVLTEQEQASNSSMMVCVSRCIGDRLVLDIF